MTDFPSLNIVANLYKYLGLKKLQKSPGQCLIIPFDSNL